MILVFAVASVASATPDRVTTVSEALIGANASHIYTLRTLWSNSGVHSIASEDLFVVEIDINTGALTQYWPVRSSISNNIDHDPGTVQETERFENNVNPYDVLREKRAVPTASHVPNENFGYKFKNGDLITNYNDPTGANGATTLLKSSEISARLESSHQKIFDLYPPLDDDTQRDMSGRYIGPPKTDEISVCEITETVRPLGAYGTERVVPILLSCGDEYLDSVDLWVFVPNWEDVKK